MPQKIITQAIIIAFAVIFVSFLSNELQKVLVINLFAQSADVNKQTKIELPQDFLYPNGIARATDGTLYVGSVVSGEILQIAPDGKIETFFPGSEEVFAATSLRLDERRGILWELLQIFWAFLMPREK